MNEVIVPAVLGLFIIYIGISNMKGNISTLHSYHRKRVKDEDILPFGRMVGKGTIICGVALLLYAIFSFIAAKTMMGIFTACASVIIVIGLVVGLGLNFWAMFKYNKGIF